ncbi:MULTISPECIES: DUF2480 family protein [Olivibacter]|jgi:hypothetical protein|uniref:DUF2480 domain-containing protein n=3 Tax=Sphingobacteriaceae TaxID=84566 RepID=F4CF90_SPHS2|nr:MULTISPECIES: DUF2480 family protein [Olivibacter]MCL4640146.1 DUF2480 family protein [Olivibacter sp. UJ_SKK_5.1]MDM8174082.1 DUF2480 family protein [Olivibacter sp. 47]MDX3917199.1 DUF2480 family protein [Pseudosphingobacterium sp.]QEL03863.1 DUF2480 family protein [Olivibacter sp. LS-1]
MNSIENVANKIQTLDIKSMNLMDYKPTVKFKDFDLAPYLYKGLILKEKEFKENMERVDWSVYKGTAVSLFCAIDAIIPQWVYMYIAAKLSSFTDLISCKHQREYLMDLWIEEIKKNDFEYLRGQKVVLKANPQIPEAIYIGATNILLTYRVKALMYGEIGMPKVVFKQID